MNIAKYQMVTSCVCVCVCVCVQVASAAFQREKAVETKSSSVDLVTETDKKVEQLIFSFLREQFPAHR